MNAKSNKSHRPSIVPDSIPQDEIEQMEREQREAAAASMRNEAETPKSGAAPISEVDAKSFVGMIVAVISTVLGTIVWFFQTIWYSFRSAVYTVADNDTFLTILTAAFIAALVLVGYTAVTMAGPVMATGVVLAVGHTTLDFALMATAVFAAVSTVVLFFNSLYEKVTGRRIDAKAAFAYNTVRAAA